MIGEVLTTYLGLFPNEQGSLDLLMQQIADDEPLNNRQNFRGHITGSAIVLSPDKKNILLIHHKLFDAWQQPGGHWEQDEPDPLEAARREAIEETGTNIKTYLPTVVDAPLVPLDIDTHEVPERPHKGEPQHYHHDFRYVFVTADKALYHQAAEVYAASWFKFDDPQTERVKSCIEKLRQLRVV